ncbi:gephyrin-like molybdotransferase Glp [uncultured Enterovirga sp.]|uniref:molybdopterin molybdotransferase MoeA n=1 Tax=uncultured Enterovirga sp. TaxID=2026352 RepID=UPI0035CC179E
MNIDSPGLLDLCSEAGGLISLDEACERAASHASPVVETEAVSVHRASGRTLAEDVSADLALPAFDQSAMDGFALALQGGMLPPGARLPLQGRIAAGDRASALAPGHAVRIFTGAPMPVTADAVLMQEHGRAEDGHLVLNRVVRPGDNVRRRGEDIEAGDRLLAPGERLDARHIALLSAQGRSSVLVRRRLRIGVVSTGNELVQPGRPLLEASVYDSNRPMVMTLAAQAGFNVVDGGWVPDEVEAVSRVLRGLAADCDMVVTTGGASVGEEDHSATAAVLAGGTCETLRVALKPGKPAVAGRIGSAVYLGLPGNPVSALVSWLILGGAVVAAIDGRTHRRRAGCPIPAATRFQRRAGRTEFAPGRIVRQGDGAAVEILGRGGSARLRPLVEADGLVEIDALHAPVEPGSNVLFHPFRDGFSV